MGETPDIAPPWAVTALRPGALRGAGRDNAGVSGSPSRAGVAPLVSLGFAAGVAQAVLLREGMAASGGSELSWGAVLFLWLAGMALGARAGVRWGTAAAAEWGPALAAAFAGAGVVLLRAAPALVGASPGEGVVALRAAWVWAAAVVPAAVAGGWCFPALTGRLGGSGIAGTAYALEGLGALAGGLVFTFVLAPLGSAFAVAAAFGLVLGAALWSGGRRVLATVVVAAAAGAGQAATGLLAHAGWSWSGRIGEISAWRDTHEQRLEVTSGPPFSLYADGRLVSTLPDPYRVAPIGHLVMLLHPAPRRVLAVGAAVEGSLAAMLQHPAARVDVVEEDPELARLLTSWLPAEIGGALADPRVVIRREDPVSLVRNGGAWDLIVLRDGDPSTLRRHRTRALEFFADCRRHLAPDGVLAVRVGVSDTYLGGPGGELLAALSATLRRVFPAVVGVPGEEIMLVCGLGHEVAVDPKAMAERLAARGPTDPVFPPAMLPLLLDPERARSLNRFLRTVEAPPTTTGHPRAVPLAAARVEGRGSPRIAVLVAGVGRWPPGLLGWAVAAMAAGMLARGLSGARLGGETAAVVGASSMAWFLLLLCAWQGGEGSTYAAIGALAAAFMAGLVGGSLAARGRGGEGELRVILAGGAALSVALAAAVGARLPGPAVVAALLLAGGLTGAAFPGVARRIALDDAREGAGRGFAADEAGAAVAALGFGVVVIPWVGMSAAAAALAVVQGATALALWLADRRSG